MKKKGMLLILLLMMMLPMMPQKPAHVPAYPGPIEKVMPNGDTLTIRLHGDEWNHFTTTIDGYQIIEGENGYYYYAVTNKKGEVVVSNKKAHNEDKRCSCEKRFIKRKAIKKAK